MSHFSVAVIHKADQDIEELLAPYDENLEVEPYIGRTVQEMINDAKKRVEHAKEILAKNEDMDEESYHVYNDITRARNANDLYWAERRYTKYFYGEHEYDEIGHELTTYNPDSKWDWWVIGGRFCDMLDVGGGYRSDSAPIKAIHFNMDKDVYKECYDWYKEYVDGNKEWNSIYSKEYYQEYYGSAETYARHCAEFGTWAVITPDGEWHEQGEMGWFGLSGDTPDEAKNWHETYYDCFIKNADPELIMTIVDCHI
ncbi:MAG: hypothetical protein IJA72_03160 [Clostridia bacterium]|nr:hypothetical protein [Clostridia bacterium]